MNIQSIKNKKCFRNMIKKLKNKKSKMNKKEEEKQKQLMMINQMNYLMIFMLNKESMLGFY